MPVKTLPAFVRPASKSVSYAKNLPALSFRCLIIIHHRESWVYPTTRMANRWMDFCWSIFGAETSQWQLLWCVGMMFEAHTAVIRFSGQIIWVNLSQDESERANENIINQTIDALIRAPTVSNSTEPIFATPMRNLPDVTWKMFISSTFVIRDDFEFEQFPNTAVLTKMI